ncbi:hypothetical protein PY092_17195 [Muricauda sp. 334s03]|uniref:Uncharacterized protein n=1 Tax=Flagellimonas yonaguniensis TaxID=3031325 RepID=A0ABT5Y378_9FLAO|nr:hypothetical protein [[Muricauda] yonaguniensis]MDF0717903.1 hypothetical protein [[Muricauda] yonaguniensis]
MNNFSFCILQIKQPNTCSYLFCQEPIVIIYPFAIEVTDNDFSYFVGRVQEKTGKSKEKIESLECHLYKK